MAAVGFCQPWARPIVCSRAAVWPARVWPILPGFLCAAASGREFSGHGVGSGMGASSFASASASAVASAGGGAAVVPELKMPEIQIPTIDIGQVPATTCATPWAVGRRPGPDAGLPYTARQPLQATHPAAPLSHAPRLRLLQRQLPQRLPALLLHHLLRRRWPLKWSSL